MGLQRFGQDWATNSSRREKKNTSEMFLGAWELKRTLSKRLPNTDAMKFQTCYKVLPHLHLTISLTSPPTSPALPWHGVPQVSHAWQTIQPGWGIWVPVPVTWNSLHLDANITHLPAPTSQLTPSLGTYQNCKILKHTHFSSWFIMFLFFPYKHLQHSVL